MLCGLAELAKTYLRKKNETQFNMGKTSDFPKKK